VRFLENPKSGASDFDDMGPEWVSVRNAAGPQTLRSSDKETLSEGPIVTRMVRTAADMLDTPAGIQLAASLGAPPKIRRSDGAKAVLSDREIAVLRFLPTQLTNQEIASECLMSVNTVKTHIKHIYATLNASSRSAAVERARVLGLL
jgi:DNA-binding CsgD family transcriptional regulator